MAFPFRKSERKGRKARTYMSKSHTRGLEAEQLGGVIPLTKPIVLTPYILYTYIYTPVQGEEGDNPGTQIQRRPLRGPLGARFLLCALFNPHSTSFSLSFFARTSPRRSKFLFCRALSPVKLAFFEIRVDVAHLAAVVGGEALHEYRIRIALPVRGGDFIDWLITGSF